MSYGLMILSAVLRFILAGVAIFALLVFIMLAKKGITALDIYIDEKTNKRL